MKYIKTISWFLGVSMFMVGFLKFFNPFKSWYGVQISTSGLNELAYVMGIVTELFAGLVMILGLLVMGKLSKRIFSLLLITSSIMIVLIMIVGFYVHLHPNVMAEILPLKIKPPFIPGFFLFLAMVNVTLIYRMNIVTKRDGSLVLDNPQHSISER